MRCTWQLRECEACANWICVWTNKGQTNSSLQKGISHLHVPLISQTPGNLLSVQMISLPSTFLSLALSLSLVATVNKECAGFPQALKESLTLHSHNHFRPGCLGRHLHWDLPATRCRPNQTTEQRKFRGKKSTVKQRRASQTEERDQSENIKDLSFGSRMSYSPPSVMGWFGALLNENDRL